MEPKTIIAIVLVAFIIGGFIFLQVKIERRNNLRGADEILRPLILFKEEPMKTMKTVESRVLQILRDCPETRNEDMLLFYRYYNRYADYLRAGELPLEDLAYNYKAYGLPCFESIRRARQRVQSLFPELSRNSANEQDGSVVIVININGG